MVKDFAGKVAFITGGASGAGFGQAKVFSEVGCKIVIADIRQDHLDEAIAYFREKKAEVHAIQLDIMDRKAYAEAADEVMDRTASGDRRLTIALAYGGRQEIVDAVRDLVGKLAAEGVNAVTVPPPPGSGPAPWPSG